MPMNAIHITWHASKLTCRQETECSAHCSKVRQTCGDAVVFGTFFSLTRVRSIWPVRWARFHQKEMIPYCGRENSVERMLRFVCACDWSIAVCQSEIGDTLTRGRNLAMKPTFWACRIQGEGWGQLYVWLALTRKLPKRPSWPGWTAD